MEKFAIHLQKLKEDNNLRKLPDSHSAGMIDLCSNDNLGINANENLRTKFYDTHGHKHSFGAGASRLLGAKLDVHEALENTIARCYQTEAALFFNSGYHANTGILSSLTSGKDLIIADKYIHASVIDGARLSDAKFMRYRHLDYEHLERLLTRHRYNYENVFIVSESIFSMDGDVADIQRLIELKERFHCFLYIDEAHALGVCGQNGLGCAEAQGCISGVDFIVGTMGKAMASIGAFVACKQVFKDYLINHARSFIFSTALPPVNMAWSLFVFQEMQAMQEERKHLNELSSWFAESLSVTSGSHIVPFITGSNEYALTLSESLRQEGFNVLPVRYPTVPKGTARLRFSLNAGLTKEQLTPLQTLLKTVVL